MLDALKFDEFYAISKFNLCGFGAVEQVKSDLLQVHFKAVFCNSSKVNQLVLLVDNVSKIWGLQSKFLLLSVNFFISLIITRKGLTFQLYLSLHFLKLSNSFVNIT